MANSLVVLVILAQGVLSLLHLASAQDCESSEVVVGAGKNGTVYHKDKLKSDNVSETLFMQHELDFEGVIVNMTEEDGTIHEVWFPLDNCWQDGDKWQEMQVNVASTIILRRPKLYFTLRINTCSKKCIMTEKNLLTITLPSIKELSIVARGSSLWRSTTPLTTCLSSVSPTSQRASNITLCVKPPPSRVLLPTTTSVTLSVTSVTSVMPVTLNSSVKICNDTPSRPKLPTEVVAAIVVMVVVERWWF